MCCSLSGNANISNSVITLSNEFEGTSRVVDVCKKCESYAVNGDLLLNIAKDLSPKVHLLKSSQNLL